MTPLLTQLSWSNHLLIMSGCKSNMEREFYMRLCIKEGYSKRELERQINSGYYERYMLSKEKLLPEPIKGLKENPFLDSYVIEFLDLPKNFKESDLRKGLIQNMKDFILEVGKDFTFIDEEYRVQVGGEDFTFIDEEYRVQVGGEDFRIDLLFFHRGLQCLVAFELKIGKFKPEYISKMDFYLEALDRQKKKENENPSVGMILCASKDDEVVEYAMSRTLSPMMVAEYKLQLPDKAVLQELINMPLIKE
ncbi:PDDEXK nuclease domain-containing protein [Blautia sp.]|uniref:PDDEXK nuclease domain-containing protein n=2 Tax=Clostridia TaxID=186801 RepID=UPI002579B92D|nr:PDDEXK nuclease domain-containing protein [Blautia sp.]